MKYDPDYADIADVLQEVSRLRLLTPDDLFGSQSKGEIHGSYCGAPGPLRNMGLFPSEAQAHNWIDGVGLHQGALKPRLVKGYFVISITPTEIRLSAGGHLAKREMEKLLAAA